MSWLQKLHETYDAVVARKDQLASRPWPLSHVVKQAHVEIAIDADGNFRRARRLDRLEESTVIPATERSAGRTSGAAAHPLCEELSYCAADLPDGDGDRFATYLAQLEAWCDSTMSHSKARAVLAYVRRKTVWSDLCTAQVFPVQVHNAAGKKTGIPTAKVFVRWRIEAPGDPCSGTWQDESLMESWSRFEASRNASVGFCMATGELRRLAQSHPRFVRGSDDGGKLISANDFSGFTFRGRFTDKKDDYEKQGCSIGFEASQKAHNALRWLIARQGWRQGDQAVVSWAVSGVHVPDPMADTYALLGLGASQMPVEAGLSSMGQVFALRLNKAINGYRAKLDPGEDIVVMALDSATSGRMAITYYLEIRGSEFLERIEGWHSRCAWPQDFGKECRFIGAAAPRDIAQAAYGRRLDKTLIKVTCERLLPCIVDGRPIPRDLVEAAARRAANRAGFKPIDRRESWERVLGIACSLFKGYHADREYQMELEIERATRDYLYGQLLAIADDIEGIALRVAGESRDTTAARLMQRFADRPFSTWRTIELALSPYKSRLRAKRGAVLYRREQQLDATFAKFAAGDFASDVPLSAEFLLGYHVRRRVLRPAHSVPEDVSKPNSTT